MAFVVEILSSWVFCCFISSLNAGAPLRLNLLKRKSCELIRSIWRNGSISFPCKISFLDFGWLVNPSWYQMGKGKEMSYNVSKLFFVVCLFVLFFAFVQTSLCVKLKNFKTNKAILTIVIKRKSIMMKTLLGNISVQKKKNHSEVCLGLMFGCGLCYLGQRIRSNHLIFFSKSNYWKGDAEQLDKWNVAHIQIYLTLSLKKKCSLETVESHCSVC